MPIVSYAQHNEDIMIYALLYDIKNGFYVDVGANHHTNDSVTKFFYQRGWSGVNIEPIPKLYKEFIKARPRDININTGVDIKKGELMLREFGMGRHGLSGFRDTSKAPSYLPYTDYRAPVQPLRDILSKAGVTKIDFLKVDVEGMEKEVLRSNDWKRFRPSVVLVEDNNTQEWYDYLLSKGYQEVAFDGLNRYFTLIDLGLNLDKYQYILNQEVISYDTLRDRKEIQRLREKLQQMYELHTELGLKWHALSLHPEKFLSGRQLKKGLLAKVKQKMRQLWPHGF